jgi:protein-S-isoprenylcysteine O-methyltransferase Ste14
LKLQTRIPPPLWALLFGAAMWQLHRRLPLVQWLDPPWHRLGLLPAVLGATIDLWSAAVFRRAGTTVNPLRPERATRLVRAGPYRVSRNPMYLGLALVLSGWAIWLGSASPCALVPAFVLCLTWLQILPEERALRAAFGQEYARYCGDTHRWLGIRRRPSRAGPGPAS